MILRHIRNHSQTEKTPQHHIPQDLNPELKMLPKVYFIHFYCNFFSKRITTYYHHWNISTKLHYANHTVRKTYETLQ
jgi:hypothetical protein